MKNEIKEIEKDLEFVKIYLYKTSNDIAQF